MKTELRLSIGCLNDTTDITDVYFTSPLKIGTPAGYNDRFNVVFMMASAGLLKGDRLDYDIYCGERTRTRMTDQSYTKIFNTGEGSVSRHQKITVAKDASLFYCPLGTIPFKNSRFNGETEVYLHEDSEFLLRDLWAAGRIGMGESFEFTHYRSRTIVYVDDRPAFLDHCLLEPEKMDLSGPVFMDGRTHQGTFYYYGPEEKQRSLLEFDPKHKICGGPVLYGSSRCSKGVGIRILAQSAVDIERIFDILEAMLDGTGIVNS